VTGVRVTHIGRPTTLIEVAGFSAANVSSAATCPPSGKLAAKNERHR
jgi:hypothetical protein